MAAKLAKRTLGPNALFLMVALQQPAVLKKLVSRKRCKSIKPLQKYVKLIVRVIKKAMPKDLFRQSMLANEYRLATLFSGIGTMEVAATMLAARTKSTVKVVSSCDLAKPFRALLLEHTPTEACVFGDATTSLPYVRPDNTFARNVQMVLRAKGNHKTIREAWCWRHGRECTEPNANVVGGGSPCVDHSRPEHGFASCSFCERTVSGLDYRAD